MTSASDEANLTALRERAEAQALNGRWREAQDLWQQAIALMRVMPTRIFSWPPASRTG